MRVSNVSARATHLVVQEGERLSREGEVVERPARREVWRLTTYTLSVHEQDGKEVDVEHAIGEIEDMYCSNRNEAGYILYNLLSGIDSIRTSNFNLHWLCWTSPMALTEIRQGYLLQ